MYDYVIIYWNEHGVMDNMLIQEQYSIYDALDCAQYFGLNIDSIIAVHRVLH